MVLKGAFFPAKNFHFLFQDKKSLPKIYVIPWRIFQNFTHPLKALCTTQIIFKEDFVSFYELSLPPNILPFLILNMTQLKIKNESVTCFKVILGAVEELGVKQAFIYKLTNCETIILHLKLYTQETFITKLYLNRILNRL